MKTILRELEREVERRKTRKADRFSKYQRDPVKFIELETFGTAWSKQREICQSVVDNRFTAVQSCHGSGKTAIAARIGAWWLSVWPPGEAFLVSSAPTGAQVRGLLWREINKVHRKAGLPGRCNQTEWIMPPNEIVGWGRAVRDTDPTAFQGIHARRVLVVLDEACGVTKTIHDAAETLVTNEDSRLLEIGNPDDPTTAFATNCKPGSGYNVIRISAFNTPNFTGEDVPDYLRHVLVSPIWVEERKRRWGENSPLYTAKVLGLFPDVSSDGLIPLSALHDATNREIPAGTTRPNELGVDVARFGDDKSTFYHRVGIGSRRVGEHRKRDLMELVGKTVKLANMLGVDAIKIDDTGMGGGVTDRLNELRFEGKLKAKIVPVNNGTKPQTADDAERFFNLRCQLHWMMRERFISGNIVLLPPVDLIADPEGDNPIEGGLDDLLAQAGSIKYRMTSDGKIRVETKAEMKKAPRNLPSPDDFDGLTLAFAPSDIGGDMVLPFSAAQVTEPYKRVPQFWQQVVAIHIERETFAAVWLAYAPQQDAVHIVDEYVAPLSEMPIHVEAIRARAKFDIPVVFALAGKDRTKRVGMDMAYRMQGLGLHMQTVDESDLEKGIPEIRARFEAARMSVYENLSAWLAEMQRFRKNGEGEILDGHIPLMHATALGVQYGIVVAVSEADANNLEEASEREARSFDTDATRSSTGY